MTLISLLVPARDEAATVGELLRRIDDQSLDVQVIVVDDGSRDGTADVVEEYARDHPHVVLLRQPPRGKGAAVRAALARAEGEICVIQDADLEYDPSDLPALIQPIVDGVADAVYGSRLSGGRPQRAYLFWHLVGNRVLSLVAGVLYNTTLSDMETGYKALRTDLLRSIDLRRDDFTVEPEITAKIAKRKVRIYEVPIAYYGRTYDEGKKITWRDGLKALWVLVRIRLEP